MLKLLAVAWLGVSAGAMLAAAALLVPWWRTLAPETFFAWFAVNAERMFVFFTALQPPAALLAVGAAVLAWRAKTEDRFAWAVAAACAVAVLVPYFVFFQRANAGFAAAATPDLAAELARYAAWQWVRVGLGLLAFVASLLARRR